LIVVDTSAALEFLADLEHGSWVRQRLESAGSVHAPHLLDVEFLGALRRLVWERRMPQSRATAAIAALVDFDVTRHAHLPLLARIWDLRTNLSAADAAFVALAEGLGADLVTIDGRLGRAPGIRATVLVP